jgi:hypothetical protein
MAKVDISKKKVITPEFRVSFPAIHEPKAFNNQAPKYSLVALFPKNTDISSVKKAAEWAAVEEWGTDKKSWPKGIKFPFRDGNEKQDQSGYKDHIFVSASSKQKVGLIDKNRNPILEPSEFYAGCYARASMIAFAYDVNGNKGVSFSLQNVQKTHDGIPFSGRKRAEDEFEEFKSDEETDDVGSSDEDSGYEI